MVDRIAGRVGLDDRVGLDRRLGWGIVGCGWVARDFVAPGIAGSSNGRLVALFDPEPTAVARLLDGLPDGRDQQSRVRADLQHLLADPSVEAVYIATPNDLHGSIAVAAAAAGKHVLCEKPMARDVAEAGRMIQACRDAGVTYATAFDQRFHARHRRLRDLVAEGALGIVTQARLHYACWLPGDWSEDNWRIDPSRAGGGALIDLAPHGIDLLEVILGDEWETLGGFTQRKVHPYPVDDGAILAGRFRGGTLATLHVGYNCPDAYPRRTLELIGTRAMARASDTMGQVPGGRIELIDAVRGEANEVWVDPEEDRSPFRVQVEAFADSILSGSPYPYTPERDLRNLALMEAACR